MAKYLLGLDVGGTKTEAALIKIENNPKIPANFRPDAETFLLSTSHMETSLGSVVHRQRIATNRINGYRPVLEGIKNLIFDTCHEAKIPFEQLAGIGIGLPGTIDPQTQIMLNGNTRILIGEDLCGDLNKLLPSPIKIKCENDANLFALAEVLCGAGQIHAQDTGIPVSKQIGLGIILGTGCGGGIVAQERIIQGRHGGGGEIGHTELITDGHPCYCGKNGCAEQYLSGPGIEALFASRIYSQIGKLPSAKEIFDMAQAREPLATAIIEQYRKYLIKFLTKLTNIFDPDFFVFGGGLSNQNLIYEGLEERLAGNTFVPCAKPKIYKHVLGDSAGVVGAAMLLVLE
jgi:fructokinase